MDYTGKAHFSLTIVSPANLEVEGDRIFKLHAEWMEKTHHREGEKALLQYDVAKRSEPDGKVTYVLTEVYATEAGLKDHHEQGDAAAFIGDFHKWLSQCQVTGGDAVVVHSLW